MARKHTDTEDDFYRRSEGRAIAVSGKPEPDEDAELDLRNEDKEDEESPFLRAQKPVPVRRGAVTRRTANRLKIALIAGGMLAAIGAVAAGLYAYGASSWRFRIDSSDQLEILGATHVSRSQVREVFGADIGRNIFFVPLEQRRAQLEQIPWVESAAVMRLLPNRLRVQITERTPVAFVRLGSKVSLIDAHGVVMDPPAHSGEQFSFPVISGMRPADDEPLSTRAARMKIFMRLIGDLDSSGARYSQALSEVDLSDPEDVKATFADSGSAAVLVHLGDQQFLDRYRIYLAHINQWRQQFPRMESVDLRYEREVVINSAPDASAASGPSQAATKAVVRLATKKSARAAPQKPFSAASQ